MFLLYSLLLTNAMEHVQKSYNALQCYWYYVIYDQLPSIVRQSLLLTIGTRPQARCSMGANGPWGICRTFLGGPQEVTHAFYFGCRVDFQEENFSLTTNWIWVFNGWSVPMMSYYGQHWAAMNISLGIKSWLHCGVDEAKLPIHEIISLSILYMQLNSYMRMP